MPSLNEAYDRAEWTERNPWRILGGIGLGLAGALAILAAIGLVAVNGDTTAAKGQAGVLAGLGVPAMLLAVVFVLPADTRERTGAVIGSAVTVVGVWVFVHAYPARWTESADPLAFEAIMIYGLGGAVALWYVFTALATVRLRNNPQGTVQLEVIRGDGTRTVAVSRDQYDEMVSDGGDASAVIQELDGEQ